MKRLTAILTIVCLGVLSFMVTSCDSNDDFDTAAVLNGTWHGSLGQYYSDVYGDGYEEWETEFRFNNYNENATSGDGVEVDYDPGSMGNYKYYDFRWNVAYGNIYLYYENGDELVIRNYSLSNHRLRGELETTEGVSVANIDLERTSYWPWDDSYNAKSTRSTKDVHMGKARTFKK